MDKFFKPFLLAALVFIGLILLSAGFIEYVS